MDKEQIDELYHLLRVASNEKRDNTWAFALQHLVFGLARHLLAGGDYQSLIQYSTWYGEKFLLEPTHKAIKDTGWEFSRIVELGAGLSWLGRGLSSRFGFLPTLFVDKRPWSLVDVVADLETEQGIKEVLSAMKDNDLVVMADVVHCLANPKEILAEFHEWPLVILEYCPTNIEYRLSFKEQITRYGASYIEPQDYETMFPGRQLDIKEADPYIILLVK